MAPNMRRCVMTGLIMSAGIAKITVVAYAVVWIGDVTELASAGRCASCLVRDDETDTCGLDLPNWPCIAIA